MFRPKKEDFRFRRGDRVKALDGSGVEGMVVGWYWDGHAQLMYTINVPVPEDKAKWVGETNSVVMDECSLELVEAAKPGDQMYHEFEANYKFNIGDKVCNVLAPSCEGRIRTVRCFTNLCFSYDIIRDEAKDDGKPKNFIVSENFAKRVEGDVNPLEMNELKKAKVTRARTGGPSFIASGNHDD